MSLSSIFSVLFIFVLVGQLALLQPALHFNMITYGTSAASDLFQTAKNPKIFETAQLVVAKQKPSSIIFVGDIMLARNVEHLMRQNGYDYPFKSFDLRLLTPNAYVVGNFESSIPKVHTPTNAGEMSFSVDQAFLPALFKAGFTHLSVANNHTFDHGDDGLENTFWQLSTSGFTPFGNPKRFSNDSVTFLKLQHTDTALIGLHAIDNIPSESSIKNVFEYATKNSDFQIVYVHWGTEYSEINVSAQRNLAEVLVKAGADLVIGHHPHVVENIDLIDGVPVLYSLGNYIFDQYLSTETEQGLVASIQFNDAPLLYLVPVTSEMSPSQPRAMTTAQHATFLRNLADRSAPELRIFIERGVIPLNSLVASSSKIAMMNK